MASSTTISKKILTIFKILKMMQQGREICPTDEALQSELEIGKRDLYRYMDNISEIFDKVIIKEIKSTAKNRKSVAHYRISQDTANDNVKVLKYLAEQNEDTSYLLSLIQANDPKLFDKYNKTKIGKNISNDQDIFHFKTNPFEEAKHSSFAILQKAVKEREYRNIDYEFGLFENVKCLKLIFTDSNWYLLGEYDKNLQLFRISFIKKVAYPSDETNYKITKGLEDRRARYLETMQNAMSLSDKPLQKAILRASSKVSHYFQNSMKKFFISQEFIRANADGSVDFSVKYTQPLEILPFVKRWLPDIEIIEPQELRLTFKNDIKEALKKL
jgi:predicted DNA-binding transcriptional regulator YafY